MGLLVSVVMFSLFAPCALARQHQPPTIEYGSPAELRGVTRIFIDTGTDIKNRERFVKEIEKHKAKAPNLTVVSKPEDAEVHLVFNADVATRYVGSTTTPATSGGLPAYTTPTYVKVALGNGFVAKPIASDRVRLLMDFSASTKFRWSKMPSEKFAKKFIEEYVKANK